MKKPHKTRGHQEQVVVFGYGSQGSAQAQNLRDSGKNVRVFLRPGSPHIQEVKEAGIPITTDAGKAAKQASIAAVLIPDGEQPKLYKHVLEPNLKPGAAIVFAHGFAIHYRRIVPRPDLDVLLVAPLGQGEIVRSDFVKGRGVPCIVAVAQDATGKALIRGHEYAKAISKTGPFIDTTFAEEVETDLFAEQAVLCGGVPELIRAAFETLVGAGYTPDVAYFSCLRELRAITKLLDRHSIAGMRKHISDTARFGAVTRGPRIIDSRTRRVLTGVLEEIRSGAFTQELDEERKRGFPNVRSRIEGERRHQLEKIHRRHSPNNH